MIPGRPDPTVRTELACRTAVDLVVLEPLSGGAAHALPPAPPTPAKTRAHLKTLKVSEPTSTQEFSRRVFGSGVLERERIDAAVDACGRDQTSVLAARRTVSEHPAPMADAHDLDLCTVGWTRIDLHRREAR